MKQSPIQANDNLSATGQNSEIFVGVLGLELLLELESIFTLQYIKLPIINNLRSIWSSEGLIKSVQNC